MTQKIIRIGVDLDGVVVNKPPIVPKKLIEWLIRSHTNHEKKYRFPKTNLERWIRIQSHHYKLRPPLSKNLQAIKNLEKLKSFEVFFISSRYRFLANQTRQWFKNYFPQFDYKKVFINLENQQPHLFKEEMIRKLKIDYFLEDDQRTISYLRKRSNLCPIIKINRDKQITKKLFS
ncbi:hypothetical protein ISS42_02280 [Candidatus Shapirobacteria bacterium]|nr:hypothetical protein [Candidatus Shapirobacteria bacterium]